MFSPAQYDAAVQKITGGLQSLSGKMQEIVPAAERGVDHWYVAKPVARMVVFLAEKCAAIAKWIFDKITDLIKGALAPLYMYLDSREWSDIEIKANEVTSGISEESIKTRILRWTGPASESYVTAVKPQGTASAKVGSIANSMNTILTTSALAGLAFYIGIGVLLVKFIAAISSAIASFGIVIASWYGVAAIIEEAGTTPLAIMAAVGALGSVLAPQIDALNGTRAARIGNDGFDNGKWPVAVTGTFNDGSVKDGVPEWSVKPE